MQNTLKKYFRSIIQIIPHTKRKYTCVAYGQQVFLALPRGFEPSPSRTALPKGLCPLMALVFARCPPPEWWPAALLYSFDRAALMGKILFPIPYLSMVRTFSKSKTPHGHLAEMTIGCGTPEWIRTIDARFRKCKRFQYLQHFQAICHTPATIWGCNGIYMYS